VKCFSVSSHTDFYEWFGFSVYPVVLLCCCQNLQSELGSKIFRELLEYVSTSHSRASDIGRPHVLVSEIPAAALVMGKCCFISVVFKWNSVELMIIWISLTSDIFKIFCSKILCEICEYYNDSKSGPVELCC